MNLEEILEWIYILGAIGGFLIFLWKLSAKIEKKKNDLDQADKTIENEIQALTDRVTELEDINKQAVTNRVAKSEDTGTLLQELLDRMGEK